MRHRPICFLLVPFSMGIIGFDRIGVVLTPGHFLVLTLGLAAAFLGAGERIRLKLLCLMVLVLAFGWLKAQFVVQAFSEQTVLAVLDRPAKGVLVGRLDSAVEEAGDGFRAVVTAMWIDLDHERRPIRGRVLVRWSGADSRFSRGDIVAAPGRLQRPGSPGNPGEFDYRRYLMHRGIAALFYVDKEITPQRLEKSAAHNLSQVLLDDPRQKISRLFRETINDDAISALMQGLVLGQRGAISQESRTAFADAGVIHVLAVSGLHVGFVAVFLLGLARLMRLAPRPTFVFLAFGLIYFAGLTGFKPPVVRAVTMAILFMLGRLLHYRVDLYNVLAAAALLILLLNPFALFAIGFQLSFSAVFAIAFLYPKLTALCYGNMRSGPPRPLRWITDLLLVSLSAQIGTLPLTLVYFGQIPILGIAANLVVIPTIQIVVSLGFLLIGSSFVSAPAADLLGKAIYWILSGLTAVVKELADLPFAKLNVSQSLLPLLAISLCLCALGLMLAVRRRFAWMVFVGLACCNGLVWARLAHKSQLEVVYLDVGQGDAALVYQAGKYAFLIDAGPWTQDFDAGERKIIPYLRRRGIDSLDALFLSHPHTDHIGGVRSIIQELDVKAIYAVDPGEKRPFPDYRSLCDSMKIDITYLAAGDTLGRFQPLKVSVLSPAPFMHQSQIFSTNNRSMVLLLEYGKSRLLFTGDIEQESEALLTHLDVSLKADVLKVAHHGSKSSTTAELLSRIQPELAVIPVGLWNRHNHPGADVLDRLQDQGIAVHRTDHHGALILKTDGDVLVWQSIKHEPFGIN